MEKQYTIINGELYHYGVPGMKWGKRKARTVHEDYRKAHSKKSVKEMSDEELKNRNKRLEAESNYKRLTKQASVGNKALKTFLAGAATITAVAGAVAVYKKYGSVAAKAIKNMSKSFDKKLVNLDKPLTFDRGRLLRMEQSNNITKFILKKRK